MTRLAAICSMIQLAGLGIPLGVTATVVLLTALFVVGAASGDDGVAFGEPPASQVVRERHHDASLPRGSGKLVR